MRVIDYRASDIGNQDPPMITRGPSATTACPVYGCIRASTRDYMVKAELLVEASAVTSERMASKVSLGRVGGLGRMRDPKRPVCAVRICAASTAAIPSQTVIRAPIRLGSCSTDWDNFLVTLSAARSARQRTQAKAAWRAYPPLAVRCHKAASGTRLSRRLSVRLARRRGSCSFR